MTDHQVVSRRGGYEYQSEVGALRLIDVLAKKADYVLTFNLRCLEIHVLTALINGTTKTGEMPRGISSVLCG